MSTHRGVVGETLGATNIMVDSNNVTLRSRVKLWDDNITIPHLTRYYDYNMQYHKDDSIKGDFKVVRERKGPWALYNLAETRTETRDLAGQYPQRVRELTKLWDRRWGKSTK